MRLPRKASEVSRDLHLSDTEPEDENNRSPGTDSTKARTSSDSDSDTEAQFPEWSKDNGSQMRAILDENDTMETPPFNKEARARLKQIARNTGLREDDTRLVTVQMANMVLSTEGDLVGETPQVERSHRYIHTKEAWYINLKADLEWTMLRDLEAGKACDKPVTGELTVHQGAWWDTGATADMLAIAALRYNTPPNIAGGGPANETMTFDPFFAPMWAINWRLSVISRLKNAAPVDGLEMEKLNMPLGAFVAWIALEMRHNLQLAAEAERMHAYNKGKGTEPLLVSTNLINIQKYAEDNNQDPDEVRRRGRLTWNPERDAMFRMERYDNYCVTLTRQPWWCEYAAKPGGAGKGPPPNMEALKPFLNALPQVERGFDNWDEQWYLTQANHGPPDSTQDEHQAMVTSTIPHVLYSTQACLEEWDNPTSTIRKIRAAGAGTGLKLPPSLAEDFESLTPKERANQTAKGNPGKPSETALLITRPQSIPTAELTESTQEDLEAMQLGCVQGCGNKAHFRFRSDVTKEPEHKCPFCQKTGARLEIHEHLEECKEMPEGWARTEKQRRHYLPLTEADECGHSFCSGCVNLSLLSAPPAAICMACGEKAKEIRTSKDAAIGKLTMASYPEIYQSTDPVAHYTQRFFQFKGYSPNAVSAGNWTETYVMPEVTAQVKRDPEKDATEYAEGPETELSNTQKEAKSKLNDFIAIRNMVSRSQYVEQLTKTLLFPFSAMSCPTRWR